jgi:hypothetical protein
LAEFKETFPDHWRLTQHKFTTWIKIFFEQHDIKYVEKPIDTKTYFEIILEK